MQAFATAAQIPPSTVQPEPGEIVFELGLNDDGQGSTEPIDTRSTRLDKGSGQLGPITIPSIPKTSPMRAIAPRFSGLPI